MKKIFLTAFAVALVLPVLAIASEIGRGPSYNLPAGQTVQGNLYAGGATVTVLGTVSKDVMVAGGTVVLNGASNANVMVAGGNINVSGNVAQDLRAVGGSVLINSQQIGGELLAAGGDLNIIDSVHVTGDTYLAGGRVEVNGTIDGVVRIAGGEVTLNGIIGKDVVVRAKTLTLGPKAVINGNLNYQAASPAKIDPAAKVTGQTVYKQLETKMAEGGKPWFVFGLLWILKLVAFALAALVIFFVFNKNSKKLTMLSVEHFWRELLRGLIILVVAPVAIILLFISVVGWAIALVGLFAYLTLIFVSGILSIFTATGLLQKYVFKQPSNQITWPKLFLGALALSVISLIPIVGWIIGLGIFLSALGTLANLNFMLMRKDHSEEVM